MPVRGKMTRQNENYNRYLLSDWRPENPAFR
ncbi:nitrite extrusion protein 2 domain protein [Salmonella enterica]|nr:nitrite extrusion protein 2 domain protein [Salmonella enterica]